jgi:hypothetical protein
MKIMPCAQVHKAMVNHQEPFIFFVPLKRAGPYFLPLRRSNVNAIFLLNGLTAILQRSFQLPPVFCRLDV